MGRVLKYAKKEALRHGIIVEREKKGRTSMKLDKWILPTAVIAGAYLVYKAFSLSNAAVKALASTGEAISSGLFDYFHPNAVGETLFFNVGFPDGSRHAVPSMSVSSAGTFRNSNLSPNYAGDGKTYRLVRSKENGMLYAVAM